MFLSRFYVLFGLLAWVMRITPVPSKYFRYDWFLRISIGIYIMILSNGKAWFYLSRFIESHNSIYLSNFTIFRVLEVFALFVTLSGLWIEHTNLYKKERY